MASRWLCAVEAQPIMSIPPEAIPIHLAQMGADDDTWRITVDSVGESDDGLTLLLQVGLQALDRESGEARQLGMTGPRALLLEPETSVEVLQRILVWIDENDGDGFLDLGTNQGSLD